MILQPPGPKPGNLPIDIHLENKKPLCFKEGFSEVLKSCSESTIIKHKYPLLH